MGFMVSVSPAAFEGKLCRNSGAAARFGIDLERAADHLDALAHADQAQPLVSPGVQHMLNIEGFSVVLDLHEDRLGKVLDDHAHAARLRVLRDVVECRLGHPVEHRPLVIGRFFHPGKGREADLHSSPLGKSLHVGVQRGNEPQVIEERRTQVAGKLMDDVHRFFDKALRVGDVLRKTLLAGAGLDLQGGKLDVYSGERLDDFIVKLTADLLALLLLGRENLAGQPVEASTQPTEEPIVAPAPISSGAGRSNNVLERMKKRREQELGGK